jgi:ribosomal protein S12 methylthiotransferase accessory factor
MYSRRLLVLGFFDQVLDAPARFASGTLRAAKPEATWRRFSPLARRAGITRIAELTGLDSLGIPVFAAIRPLARSLSAQQGKGLTPEAARVSALMESLETFTAEQARGTVSGSYRQLARRRRVVDVQQLPRPRGKLDLSARWRWIEGFDLGAGTPILVPEQAVTLDTTFANAPVFDISSNGLASGNVLVEAILHGLLEVIERDAEATWRRTGSDCRIVLDSIRDRACRALVDRIIAAGSHVFLWDLASDTGVCAIGCTILQNPHDVSWRPLGAYQGFGAHLVPEIAIARAITEAAQTQLTYISGSRDDFFPFDYAHATDRDVLVPMWDRLTAGCDDPIAFADLPHHRVRSLGEALAHLVGKLPQVIAVELTQRALGVPVVKVIVPGRATDLEALG